MRLVAYSLLITTVMLTQSIVLLAMTILILHYEEKLLKTEQNDR